MKSVAEGKISKINCSAPLLDGDGSCCYYGSSRLQNFTSPFFFCHGIKDSNSTVSFVCHLFFLMEQEKIRTLSPFHILHFLSLEYCIAFFRIISFSLNLKSLIITVQQNSSPSGPGGRDLCDLFISKVSISSQSKKAFNFSILLFFFFLFNDMDSIKVSSRKFSHHLYQVYIGNLCDCEFLTAFNPLEMFIICCLEMKLQ